MGNTFAEIFKLLADSKLVQVLSIIYFVITAIRTYDLRLIQAKEKGYTTKVATQASGRMLPRWVDLFHWAGWLVFAVLIYVSWKYAIFLFAIMFILKTIPLLERIGSVLMRGFLEDEKPFI